MARVSAASMMTKAGRSLCFRISLMAGALRFGQSAFSPYLTRAAGRRISRVHRHGRRRDGVVVDERRAKVWEGVPRDEGSSERLAEHLAGRGDQQEFAAALGV